MAKIEMDISEYDSMRETKKLLEQSLEKERLLHAEIKKLSDEKTRILEEAKMKVVKTTTTKVDEYVYVKRTMHEIWSELSRMFNYNGRIPSDEILHVHTERLINAFFEKVKTTNVPITETVTHGLDDIKNEIRNELKESIDSDTKYKLENAIKINEINISLKSENDVLQKEVASFLAETEELSTKVKELNDMVFKYQETDSKIQEVKGVLKNGYTLWNKAKLLDTIKKIIG